jgi:hypothetical protein
MKMTRMMGRLFPLELPLAQTALTTIAKTADMKDVAVLRKTQTAGT